MEPKPETFVNVEQACRLLGVSRRTVYNWMNKGLLSWHETPSGGRRLPMSELLRKSMVGTRRKRGANHP